MQHKVLITGTEIDNRTPDKMFATENLQVDMRNSKNIPETFYTGQNSCFRHLFR
jgi:hypothetical protein